MSESPSKHNADKSPEHAIAPEASLEKQPLPERTPEQHPEKTETLDVKQIKQSIEQEVSKSESVSRVLEAETSARQPILGMQRELKRKAYATTLAKTRNHLHGADRLASKVIHNPAIERASELGAQTVARPVGILWGGLAATIGSAILLYMSKRYGFEYNLLLFGLLFVAGFIVSSLLEVAVKIVRKK